MKESEEFDYKKYEKSLGLTDEQTLLYLNHKINESLRRGFYRGSVRPSSILIKLKTISIISKYCI